MSRNAEGPWYRSSKDAWYATIEGRKVSLGVKGKKNRRVAWDAWRERLENGATKKPNLEALTIQGLVDAFLANAEGRMTQGCLRNYRIYLEAFASTRGSLQAGRVTIADAENFARHPRWSDTYRANFLGCLVTVYRWAVRENLLRSNPIEHVRKPMKKSRGASSVITESEHRKLVAAADPLMSDYLTVLWHTGARPGEIAGLTAEETGRESL